MHGFVKIFLRFFVLFFIMVLTGCASGRYHRNVVEAPVLIPAVGPMVWPVKAPLLQPFGAREEGVALKGMVFSTRESQDVLAAQDGIVSFSDESLRGYGRTLIVDHADGWTTVYARNAQLLVATGDRVRKGQVIARSGSGGKGEAPQLYFEVRRDSRPVDPKQAIR